jgi:acetyl esterase/lipase
MAYKLDPEIAAMYEAAAAKGIALPKAARGDWRTIRSGATTMLEKAIAVTAPQPDVDIKIFSTKTKDNAEIELRWYQKKNAPTGPAVIYVHGGGMILGSARLYEPVVAEFASVSGVSFLSVDYRLAPEVRGTTPAEDAFAALVWLVGNAKKLGVDPARIAIMGASAGGGIGAGAVILARDRGIPLARQILLYPMLDDCNTVTDAAMAPFANWSFDDNYTGWHALLGEDIGTDRVSPVAAPARLKDFKGLPPTYIDVSDLDIFRDEALAYAQRIAAARIPVEFHLYPGAPHAFERSAPNSALARRAFADRVRIVQSF